MRSKGGVISSRVLGLRDARQRPSLRTWLRRYRRHYARTFYELDPVTGQWQRL